jgi:nucleotide-binding universal stress UspA family protein
MDSIQISATISAEFVNTKPSIQRILVPVDFSAVSAAALDYAVAIAKALGSEITVYHNLSLMTDISLSGNITLNFELNKQLQLLEKQMADFVKPYSGVAYDNKTSLLTLNSVVKVGYIDNDIEELTRDNAFDLVVVGTKGASGIEEIVFGSVAEKITNHAQCPVLVVPRYATYKNISKIVYATQFDKADTMIIDDLLLFSDYFGASITCLHVNTDQKNATENLAQLTDLEANYWFTPIQKLRFEMVYGESVLKSLYKHLNEEQPDLLAVLHKDRSFIENIFHQSISKKLVLHSKVPVLVLQERV